MNDSETLNSEDIVMENGSEDPEADKTEGDFNQTVHMPADEKQEDAVSDDKETMQPNQQQTVVTELSVSLSNGSTNGYKAETLDEESEDESLEDSTIGTA